MPRPREDRGPAPSLKAGRSEATGTRFLRKAGSSSVPENRAPPAGVTGPGQAPGDPTPARSCRRAGVPNAEMGTPRPGSKSLALGHTHDTPRANRLSGPRGRGPRTARRAPHVRPAPPAPWEGPAVRAARSQPGRLVPESLVVKLEWNGAGDPSLPLRLHFEECVPRAKPGAPGRIPTRRNLGRSRAMSPGSSRAVAQGSGRPHRPGPGTPTTDSAASCLNPRKWALPTVKANADVTGLGRGASLGFVKFLIRK